MGIKFTNTIGIVQFIHSVNDNLPPYHVGLPHVLDIAVHLVQLMTWMGRGGHTETPASCWVGPASCWASPASSGVGPAGCGVGPAGCGVGPAGFMVGWWPM